MNNFPPPPPPLAIEPRSPTKLRPPAQASESVPSVDAQPSPPPSPQPRTEFTLEPIDWPDPGNVFAEESESKIEFTWFGDGPDGGAEPMEATPSWLLEARFGKRYPDGSRARFSPARVSQRFDTTASGPLWASRFVTGISALTYVIRSETLPESMARTLTEEGLGFCAFPTRIAKTPADTQALTCLFLPLSRALSTDDDEGGIESLLNRFSALWVSGYDKLEGQGLIDGSYRHLAARFYLPTASCSTITQCTPGILLDPDRWIAESPAHCITECGQRLYTTPKFNSPPQLQLNLVEDGAPVRIDVARSTEYAICLLYTSPSPRDQRGSRMPSSA